MVIKNNENVALIDPNLDFMGKLKYITKFITRAFLIAVFVVTFGFFVIGSIYLFDLNLSILIKEQNNENLEYYYLY